VITLVLGGARSGKSEVGERLALGLPPPVTYLATARVTDHDDDLAARVAAHRRRRPAGWRTVEPPEDPIACLGRLDGTVLLDALGPWVAACLGEGDAVGDGRVAVDGAPLCRALLGREGDTVVVSEEVGLGVHPSTEAGRRFRDVLGPLNQRVAAVADRVVLVVAGQVLALKGAAA
jgi:adenosyl cobinamide kinase/adenosyl cobinamide phosphate guanylyltransferase